MRFEAAIKIGSNDKPDIRRNVGGDGYVLKADGELFIYVC